MWRTRPIHVLHKDENIEIKMSRENVHLIKMSQPAKPPIMWRTNPTHANQALPSETSTQGEGDP